MDMKIFATSWCYFGSLWVLYSKTGGLSHKYLVTLNSMEKRMQIK